MLHILLCYADSNSRGETYQEEASFLAVQHKVCSKVSSIVWSKAVCEAKQCAKASV